MTLFGRAKGGETMTCQPTSGDSAPPVIKRRGQTRTVAFEVSELFLNVK